MSVMKIKDKNGNWVPIITIKGDKGEPGKDGKDAVTDSSYNPESENAQSGKAVAEAISNLSQNSSGGHWETVIDKVWDDNDYITVVSYDAENHIFTCNSGELEWATVGERLKYAVVPVCDTNNCKTTEMPFSTFRQLSGDSIGGFTGGFVRLSDTEFTFKDTDGNVVAVPNEATMDTSKFHFEHITSQSITDLNCKKARYIITDLIAMVDGYSGTPYFNGGEISKYGNLAYAYGWIYKSVSETEALIVNGCLIEKSQTIQLATGTGTYAGSSVKNYFKTIQNAQKINTLNFGINWNGAEIPRNGSLFKLERWVE